MRELAPLLAEDGINLDDPDSIPDMETLQRALNSAVERRNMQLFTPVGEGRGLALTTLRLFIEAIADDEVELSAGTLVGMAVDFAATVEAIVPRLLEALPQTRYPSSDATWEAGVAFARRWAELSNGEYDLVLKPRGQECTVTVTIEPWDEKVDLVALLERIAE